MDSKAARVLVSLVLAGCVAPPGDAGPSAEPIVGGTMGGDPAVVVLYNYDNGSMCTGTLIAPRVVLTAKHCIQAPFAEGPEHPSRIVVGVGDDIRRLTDTLRVQSITTTPGAYTLSRYEGIDGTLIGSDVAVLLLQSAASGVEPIPIRRGDPRDLIGQTVTAVGFGETPSGYSGVKYTAMGRVNAADDRLIYVGALVCQGDSGGPMITSDGQVAGVVSFGSGACGSGYNVYNAIYEYLDMIDAVLIEAGTCLDDGEERCDGGDNDCDDLIDETCTGIGGACTANDECIGQTCEDTIAGRICTQPCDPLRPDQGCQPGFYCASAGGCTGWCVPFSGEPGMLPIGAPCERNEDCASLFCTDPGDHVRRCLSPCRGDAGTCLAGEACTASPGECGACVNEEILRADRGLGEGCSEDDECRSGHCYRADAPRAYCTRACSQDEPCPSGFHCRGEWCAAGPPGAIGDPCLDNGDCNADEREFCARRGEQRWCTRQCSDADPCPEGLDCVPAGGTQVCAPRLRLLGDACTEDAECLTHLCAIPDGATTGVCSRLCGPDVPCSTGFECRRSEDGVSAMCRAPEPEVTNGGGCAVGRGGTSLALAALALAAVALAFRRRR